jgi:uncharacterized protein (TIGR03067 family)
MHARLLIALVAVAGLTAFAPAPFPKKGRPAIARLDLESLSGTWKVLRIDHTVKGRVVQGRTSATHIQIKEGRWIFARGNGAALAPLADYHLVLHSNRSPVWLDGARQVNANPYMVGIVRHKRDMLEVVYGFGVSRPTNFDIPDAGCWRLTLQREGTP